MEIVLCYAPTTCALVPYVTLTEAAADFEVRRINMRQRDHMSADYLKINPKHKVPVLIIDGQPLSDNVAIQNWIARTFPEAKLLPGDPWQELKAISMLSWCSSGIHPHLARINSPAKFCDFPGSEESLRKALSLQVDHAVRIDTAQERNLDASQTAELLTRAIKTRDSLDVVLAGRQAGDWDQGQVGYLVAERLGWACVGLVQRLGASEGRLTAERELSGAHEVLSVAAPALLTVTNADSNRLRMAKVMDLMAAKKKPIEGLTLADLDLDGAQLAAARRTELVEVSVPEQERDCQFVEGEDAAAAAAALVDHLEERKLLGAAG